MKTILGTSTTLGIITNMAKFQIELGDWAQEITQNFGLAQKAVIPAMKMALYEGARVTADAVNRAADRNGVPWHCGIAQFQTDSDGVDTSVGYTDSGYFYNRWGQKTPIDLVVNVMNTGTTKVKGNHFFKIATESVKPLAQSIMLGKFGSEISKLLGE